MSRKRKNFIDDIKSCCVENIIDYMTKRPPKRRAIHVCEFIRLAHQLDTEWHKKPDVITAACRKFLSNRRMHLVKGTKRNIKEVTVRSDYGAVQYYIGKLQKAKLLPSNTLIPPIPSSSDVFSEKECNILGYLNLADAIKAPSLQAALNDIALEIDRHREEILKKCKEIVVLGYHEFSNTQKMIEESDIAEIRKNQNNLDPNLLSYAKQSISYFSKSHPNGFKNLIAYVAEEQGGLYTRKTFPGSHHVHTWSVNRIKRQLGITDYFATAAMCIIVDELGINVTDLCDAKVQKTKDGEFIKILEDGHVIITTIKPRANMLKQRYAPRTTHPDKVTPDSIDANAVLCMLLEMRSLHAKTLNSNYLFVMDGASKARACETEVYRMLHTRRKIAFKKIINSLPSWVIDAQPTMPKIRVSKGLLKWLENGGDTLSASIYLGNSLLTALKNYIPAEIQEFVHRKKIRDHQNIILLFSDGLELTDAEATVIAENQLSALVKNLVQNNNLKQNTETHNLLNS